MNSDRTCLFFFETKQSHISISSSYDSTCIAKHECIEIPYRNQRLNVSKTQFVEEHETIEMKLIQITDEGDF